MAFFLGQLGRRASPFLQYAQEATSGGRLAATLPRPSNIRYTHGFHTQSRRLPLSGVPKSTHPLKVISRNFSSYNKLRSLTFEEMKIKLKVLAKNTWDALGTRVQNTIIDSLGKCAVLGISGHGYLLYLKTISERQDKLEESQAKTKEESEKAIDEMKGEVDSISKSQEESAVYQEKIESELRELKFLKELWMAAVYQESSKTEVEAKK